MTLQGKCPRVKKSISRFSSVKNAVLRIKWKPRLYQYMLLGLSNSVSPENLTHAQDGVHKQKNKSTQHTHTAVFLNIFGFSLWKLQYVVLSWFIIVDLTFWNFHDPFERICLGQFYGGHQGWHISGKYKSSLKTKH